MGDNELGRSGDTNREIADALIELTRRGPVVFNEDGQRVYAADLVPGPRRIVAEGETDRWETPAEAVVRLAETAELVELDDQIEGRG
jgi:hypothetical protein